MLFSEFIHAVKIIACPRTTICNKGEQSNTSGDNVVDEEMFGFSESFFKIALTNIDDHTKINY